MWTARRLAVLIERTRDAVFALDGEGRIIAWNASAERVFGWAADEVLGRAVVDLLLPPRDDWKPRADELLADVLAGRAIESEYQLLGKDGAIRLADVCTIADPEDEGVVLVIATDVTERARVAGKLSDAARLEQLPLVASGVAHDMNNLLAIIGAALDLAAKQQAAGQPSCAAIAEARHAVHRAAGLSHQLTAIARGRPPVRSTLSLAAIARDTASFSLVGRRTTLECRIADDLWPVHADAVQISEVVQNLVLNAAEAMDDAGTILIEAENVAEPPDVTNRFHVGPHVVLRVRDHGAGIAEAHLRRVCEPFFTTKARGSGLGLATSAAIARAHEGFLRLESEVGVGTIAELWLPARASGAYQRFPVAPPSGSASSGTP